MAAKSSPHKRMKRRKPTAAEQEEPRFATPKTPASPSPALPSPANSTETPTRHETPIKDSASEIHKEEDVSVPPVLSCILPLHLAYLKDRYSLATMSVISSSKIEQKVKTLLKHLERFSYGKIDAKPGLVALHAKAPVANKMSSIIDIATRTATGGKMYQYSRLSGELMALKTKGAPQEETPGEDDDDETDSAFETMASPARPKVRSVPIMTVYLARVPVVELAAEFGYAFSETYCGKRN